MSGRIVSAHRLCPACHASLAGAPLEREAHYGLDVARCPTCGAVEPLSCYPGEGIAWIRWGVFAAAMQSVLFVAVAAGVTFLACVLSIGFTFEATDGARWRLREQFERWETTTYGATRPGLLAPERVRDWWADEADDIIVLLRRHGIEWDELALTLIPIAGMVLAGAVLSVLLLHRSRIALLRAWLVVVALVVAAFALVWASTLAHPVEGVDAVTWRGLVLPWLGRIAVADVLALLAGLMLGRSLVRWIVRLLLPPALRRPLAPLWTCDGRAVPPSSPLKADMRRRS